MHARVDLLGNHVPNSCPLNCNCTALHSQRISHRSSHLARMEAPPRSAGLMMCLDKTGPLNPSHSQDATRTHYLLLLVSGSSVLFPYVVPLATTFNPRQHPRRMFSSHILVAYALAGLCTYSCTCMAVTLLYLICHPAESHYFPDRTATSGPGERAILARLWVAHLDTDQTHSHTQHIPLCRDTVIVLPPPPSP